MTRALLLLIGVECLVGGWWIQRHRHAVRPPLPNLTEVDRVTAAEFRERSGGARSTDDWFKLGEDYLATGFFPEAEACLRHAAGLDPTAADIAYKHGFALERIGRISEANAAYHLAADRKHPRAKDCLYAIGRNHLRLEDLPAAEAAFARIEAMPGARLERAILDARAGRTAEAEAAAKLLAAEFPTAYPPVALRIRLAVARGDGAAAATLSDAFVRRARPLPTPFDTDVDWILRRASAVGRDRLFRDAGRDAQAGRTAEAEAKLREALEARWSSEIADRLAEVAFVRGRRDESRRILAEAVERGGPSVAALWRLGQAEDASRDPTEAIRTWERAAALVSGPEGQELLLDLAQAYQVRGDQSQINHYRARATLAAGIENLDRGAYDVARQSLEESTRLDPRSPNAWFELAECHRLAGRATDARAAYARCLEHDANHGRAIRARALLSD